MAVRQHRFPKQHLDLRIPQTAVISSFKYCQNIGFETIPMMDHPRIRARSAGNADWNQTGNKLPAAECCGARSATRRAWPVAEVPPGWTVSPEQLVRRPAPAATEIIPQQLSGVLDTAVIAVVISIVLGTGWKAAVI